MILREYAILLHEILKNKINSIPTTNSIGIFSPPTTSQSIFATKFRYLSADDIAKWLERQYYKNSVLREGDIHRVLEGYGEGEG
jgi:hypothetical protein